MSVEERGVVTPVWVEPNNFSLKSDLNPRLENMGSTLHHQNQKAGFWISIRVLKEDRIRGSMLPELETLSSSQNRILWNQLGFEQPQIDYRNFLIAQEETRRQDTHIVQNPQAKLQIPLWASHHHVPIASERVAISVFASSNLMDEDFGEDKIVVKSRDTQEGPRAKKGELLYRVEQNSSKKQSLFGTVRVGGRSVDTQKKQITAWRAQRKERLVPFGWSQINLEQEEVEKVAELRIVDFYDERDVEETTSEEILLTQDVAVQVRVYEATEELIHYRDWHVVGLGSPPDGRLPWDEHNRCRHCGLERNLKLERNLNDRDVFGPPAREIVDSIETGDPLKLLEVNFALVLPYRYTLGNQVFSVGERMLSDSFVFLSTNGVHILPLDPSIPELA